MATSNRVLVIGGTGSIGKGVAVGLQRAGHAVRIFTRDGVAARQQLGEGFDYAQGTLSDDNSLRRALEGCSGVHLSLPSGHDPVVLEQVQHQGAARVARLAAEQHVGHLTYTSGYLVSERFAHIPAEQAKLNAEKAIRNSGVPYTIFRPTYFTDILPRFVQGKRGSIIGKQPHPIRFLTVSDFAGMVAAAHRLPGTNSSLFVCGPEALTFEQALRLYMEAQVPGGQMSHTPFWMMGLMNRLFLKGQLTETLQLLAATEAVGEIGDPAAAIQIFGAARTTVREWSRKMG